MEKGKYETIDVARWFIRRNQISVDYDGGDPLSLLKLLKLLYYAEGCSLAARGYSLFDEKILAWDHGPVVEEVWRAYNKAPYNLEFGTEEDLASVNKISEEDNAFLEEVFNVFGKYSAWGLRNKTHEETPWKSTPRNGVIDRNIIKDYFLEHYVG